MSDSEKSVHSSSSLQEEEYVVEKIVQKRIVRGKTQYFLKWKGYPESENTWEPRENLDCPDLIRAFEEKLIQEKKSGSARSRGINDSDEPKAGSSRETTRASAGSQNKIKTTKRKRTIKVSSSDEDDVESISATSKKSDDSDHPNNQSSTTRKRQRAPRAPSEDEIDYEPTNNHNKKNNKIDDDEEMVPDKSLEPETIIGATESSGELMFLVKWKNLNKADLISSRIARIACPQTVITFFQDRIRWQEDKTQPQVQLASIID